MVGAVSVLLVCFERSGPKTIAKEHAGTIVRNCATDLELFGCELFIFDVELWLSVGVQIPK